MGTEGTPHGPGPTPVALGPSLVSRRTLLRRGAVAVGALAAAPALAACRGLQTAGGTDWSAWWRDRPFTGTLDFANWPYYIDRKNGRRPSIELFSEQTGIAVNYYRPINDVAAFVNEITPTLESGGSIGYDIIVITNGPYLSRLVNDGLLTPLDLTRLPNFRASSSDLVRDPPWDPGNRYTVAWQSGITGMAYRPEAVDALGHRPSSIQDLWDRRLEGRVGMFVDLMDLGSFGLLGIGKDPQTSAPTDWQQAAAKLREQRDDGIVRQYYDQSYVGALKRGDVWLTMAWSGDIFQLNLSGYPDLGFQVPEEGGMLWTDNMAIPAGAAHPLEAVEWMDFVYQPRVAAMIADWVQYITPVPSAQEIIAKQMGDPAVARSPLVFPSGDESFASYPVFASDADEAEWNRSFSPLLGSG